MKLYKRNCKNPDCGKEFIGTRTQQYCCPDCRARVYTPKENRKPKKPCTINEIAKEARKNGTTYGKYVAMQYLSERKIKQ